MPDARPEPACLNCGEKLLRDFCSRCGQEAVDLKRPLRRMASDYLDDVLSLDTRLLRTIGPLLFRPGRLTREYLVGRRAPYVRPLRLYMLAALVCFGVMAIWPTAALNLLFRSSDRPAESNTAKPVSAQAESPSSWVGRRLSKAEADQTGFGKMFAANLPRAFFLLLPIFALLLTLLYLRHGYRYLDHLTFALHFHAFAFVIMPIRLAIAAARLHGQHRAPPVWEYHMEISRPDVYKKPADQP